MDYLTSLIKKEIKEQFKSVRQFSSKIGVPYTTVVGTLKNGVSGSSFSTVMKICKELNITTVYDEDFTISTGQNIGILRLYEQLDNVGKYVVKSILNAEYKRCKLGIDIDDNI